MKRSLLVCCLMLGITAMCFAQPIKSAEPDKKAKDLQTQLKLTNDQTSKIAAIYTQSAAKFDEIKKKDNGDTNKMLVDVGPLRKSTIAKIKALLNTQEAAQYDKLVKQGKSSSLNGGWSDGWS